MSTRRNYGARLRVFDTGEPGDRYTMVPPASAANELMLPNRQWPALTCSIDPQGCSGHTEVQVGRHLGARIDWSELPGDVQHLAHTEWPEFTPPPNQLTSAQQDAIDRFKRKHGRVWKYELSVAWTTGRDATGVDGPLLRQVRNNLGPAWLARQQ